jgi:hypothetical protein
MSCLGLVQEVRQQMAMEVADGLAQAQQVAEQLEAEWTSRKQEKEAAKKQKGAKQKKSPVEMKPYEDAEALAAAECDGARRLLATWKALLKAFDLSGKPSSPAKKKAYEAADAAFNHLLEATANSVYLGRVRNVMSFLVTGKVTGKYSPRQSDQLPALQGQMAMTERGRHFRQNMEVLKRTALPPPSKAAAGTDLLNRAPPPSKAAAGSKGTSGSKGDTDLLKAATSWVDKLWKAGEDPDPAKATEVQISAQEALDKCREAGLDFTQEYVDAKISFGRFVQSQLATVQAILLNTLGKGNESAAPQQAGGTAAKSAARPGPAPTASGPRPGAPQQAGGTAAKSAPTARPAPTASGPRPGVGGYVQTNIVDKFAQLRQEREERVAAATAAAATAQAAAAAPASTKPSKHQQAAPQAQASGKASAGGGEPSVIPAVSRHQQVWVPWTLLPGILHILCICVTEASPQ